jgi:hypothetical protein
VSKSERTRWWLCKYVPDLPRNEPRNVGVILFSDGKFTARFPEKVPDCVLSHENWEQWIDRWRNAVERAEKPADIDAKKRRPGDNYYLEKGGALVWSVTGAGPTLDGLFERLVEVKP